MKTQESTHFRRPSRALGPIPRRVFRRCGISDAAADRINLRLIVEAEITCAAHGLAPDPDWHGEWAEILARRVRTCPPPGTSERDDA